MDNGTSSYNKFFDYHEKENYSCTQNPDMEVKVKGILVTLGT